MAQRLDKNQHRDGSGETLPWSEGFVVKKTITFAGGTTDAIGDEGGAQDPFTIFTVTGTCAVRVFGICTTLLASAGGGTVEVGVTGNTNGIIAQTTATDIDANEVWRSATPDVGIVAYTAANVPTFIVANGLDIIGTVGTADITAGVIDFYCIFIPISDDSNVVAA